MTIKSASYLSSCLDLISFTSYSRKELEPASFCKNDKYVIFDFDGTIADTYQIAVEELHQLGKKYKLSGVQPSLGRNYSLRDALKRAGVKWYQTYAIARDLKKAMELKLDLIKPYSGLVGQLSQLKENGYRLGIMTSNSTFLVEAFLEKHQIDAFDFIYSGSSLFAKNRLIRRIRHRLGTQQILYIGDEVRDIEAMKKAQVDLITVSWGWNSQELLVSHNPKVLINSVDELSCTVTSVLPLFS